MTGRPRWMDAAAAAARWHQGQFRRDGRTPYVAHVFRVAMICRDRFGCDDQDVLSIALLHDVIEDSPADYDEILEAFGETVAEGVAAMTKDMRLREDVREPTYDRQLGEASWRAKMVKLADTIDNLLDADKPTDKGAEKCRRAIAIAEADRSGRLAAAIEETRRVLTEATAGTSG